MWALFLYSLVTLAEASSPFWDTFGNGKAEISSYQFTQPRYGELRKGYSVLIFVPEDIHADTRIKIEDYSATPEKFRVPVLKLNRNIQFSTGIYNYSVMTSVFASINEKFGISFFPLKLSLSGIEWCGNFFVQLLPDQKGARRMQHSYFEKEGDRQDFLSSPTGGIYEDALPILIRELQGEWQKEGEARSFPLFPSLWSTRISHRTPSWEKATLTKSRDKRETRWQWQVGQRSETYWVANEYPHYILRWEGSDGEKGERKKTLHLPYWEKNGNKDLPLRKELGIPE